MCAVVLFGNKREGSEEAIFSRLDVITKQTTERGASKKIPEKIV